MAQIDASAALLEPLERLRAEARAARLALELPAAPEARLLRDEMVGQIGDYLLPRLRRMDAPLLIVVGGCAGSYLAAMGGARLERATSCL